MGVFNDWHKIDDVIVSKGGGASEVILSEIYLDTYEREGGGERGEGERRERGKRKEGGGGEGRVREGRRPHNILSITGPLSHSPVFKHISLIRATL